MFRVIREIIGLLIIDLKLTLVLLIITPVRYLTVKYLTKKSKSKYKQYLEYNLDYSSWYADTISCIEEIKLLGIDRIKIGEFVRKQRYLIKINISYDKFNNRWESLVLRAITSTVYMHIC